MKQLTFLLILLAIGTSFGQKPAAKPSSGKSAVIEIQGGEALEKILQSSGDRLLVFDLYADWCGPCKLLSPLLEEIALEQKDKASIYKINIDKNQDIARALRITSIPYVLFVKNQAAVHAMAGLQPKAAYVRAIEQFSTSAQASAQDTPDGELVEGTRVIRFAGSTSPKSIYVYRGETVKLVFDDADAPYSIHIPEYRISQATEKGKSMEVTFKAEKTGVFPMYCNGRCVTGDGMQLGSIVVLQYGGSKEVKFSELSTAEWKKLAETVNPVILDVRTPNEFRAGYIKGAILIPLQQLESRLKEIDAHKNRDILIYCRSGNRSVVAAQILINNGFAKVHHLRQGILDWQKSGGAVVKQ